VSPAPRRPRRRRWLIALGGFLLAGAFVVALLFTPPVQAWLVRRAVARQPGWSVDFETFGVNPYGLDARGLDFAMPGLTATSAPIAIHVLPSRLLQGELNVEQIEVQRLRLEFTPAQLRATRADPAAPATFFPGLLALLRAPLPWAVRQTAIDAEFAVRDGGRSVVVSRLSLRGGDLRAGTTGEFTYEFSAYSSLLPTGADHTVKSRGTLHITPDVASGIARLELRGDLTLPPFGALALPAGEFTLALAATATGEHYSGTLRLGTGATFDFTGDLDSARQRIDATVGLRLDSSVAAGLLPSSPPVGSLSGEVKLGLDLPTGALDATVDGDVAVSEWSRLHPTLAAVDALVGKFGATLALRRGRAELTRATFDLHGKSSSLTVALALDGPASFPLSAPLLGHLTLGGLPAAWANPFLGNAAHVDSGAFGGVWSVSLAPDLTLRVDPSLAAELGPLGLTSPHLRGIPPLTVRLSPHFVASQAHVALTCDDLVVTSPAGDRVALDVTADFDPASRQGRIAGHLAGELPTVLTSPGHGLPFALGARWEVALNPAGPRLDALELTARRAGVSAPALSVALQQPLDLAAVAAPPSSSPSPDLLKLEVHDLPLAWISRWLHHHELTGEWASGESVLRRDPAGTGFVFATRAPWIFSHLGVSLGGKAVLQGQARFSPEIALRPDLVSARLASLDVTDLGGNRIGGEAEFSWQARDKKFASTLALDAAMPALPGSAGTFGPLAITLRTHAASLQEKVSQVESFHLGVRSAAGPLLMVDSPQPLLFATKPNGELIFNSTAPLVVEVGRIPLPWIQPWLPAGTIVAGTVEPGRFLLVASPEKFYLRSTQAVRISDLHVTQHGVVRVTAAQAQFYPAADLLLAHQLSPSFQLAYSGHVYATDGAIVVAGQPAIRFEGAGGFLGDDHQFIPDHVDFSTRIDFAALHGEPILAQAGLPAAGELVLRANGGLHGDPPEFWARLSGVPSADGRRTLPPLEIAAHGQVDDQARSIHFDVATQFATVPRPSDAAFQIDVSLDQETVPIASILRSTYLDIGEVLALAEAYAPPRPTLASPAPASPVVAPRAAATAPLVSTPLGGPFWGQVRGRFDLQLDALHYTPYRIDGVRGRLELTDRALIVDGLAGEVFGGRWTGGLRVDYDPAATIDHTLAAEFRIDQFDTASALRTAFPNDYGSLDARLDLAATVRSSGRRWWELLDRVEAGFTLDARGGTARLTHPQAGTAATVLALAGTVGFSPELRALGRLLRKFADMPLERLHVAGARHAAGDLALDEIRLDSPQARLIGHGHVPFVADTPLIARPLDLVLSLAAADETAVILGHMKLLESKPQPDGFLRLKQPFAIGGSVGRPDPSALYDLLARAVEGSSGTWGLVMRRVEREIEKRAPPPPLKKTAAVP
jgi:hypothetical protein